MGCSLEQGQIVRITPMKGLEDSPYVLVASHSCDIVNPKEPFIEILPCHEIEMADGVNKGGRNQRTWDFSMGTHVFRVIAYEKSKNCICTVLLRNSEQGFQIDIYPL